MRKLLFGLILLILIPFTIIGQNRSSSDVYVKGYVRKNGTVVPGYYRSAPNNTNRDNFSTKGNINPYTGKKGYIKRDNKSSNYTSSQNSKKSNTVSYGGTNTNSKPTNHNESLRSKLYDNERTFKADDSIKFKYFYALGKRWIGLEKNIKFHLRKDSNSTLYYPNISISFNIGIKTNGGGLIMAKSRNKLRGKLIFYLENGDVINCMDRGVYDKINYANYTFYNLTREEIHKLETNNISAIEFNDFSSKGSTKFIADYFPGKWDEVRQSNQTKYYIHKLFKPYWSKKTENK
jgi:hypothetical protein